MKIKIFISKHFSNIFGFMLKTPLNSHLSDTDEKVDKFFFRLNNCFLKNTLVISVLFRDEIFRSTVYVSPLSLIYNNEIFLICFNFHNLCTVFLSRKDNLIFYPLIKITKRIKFFSWISFN